VNALPSVALVGKQGAGKTAIAKELIVKYGYVAHSWAEPVRHIFEIAYGEITNYGEVKGRMFDVRLKDGSITQRSGRELLQRIGTDAIREIVDQDFWIKSGIRRIWRPMTVNDDTRFLNEADALHKRGWVIVRVEASELIRRRRIGAGFIDAEHSSEREQESIKEDYFLDNEVRSIEEVAKELIEYLNSLDSSFIALAEKAASVD
jgi:dephospho-CoA kinase